jgi:hypothetical protein
MCTATGCQPNCSWQIYNIISYQANTVKSAKLWASDLTYGAATITRLPQQDCTVGSHCHSYESEELLSLSPSLQWEILLPISSCAHGIYSYHYALNVSENPTCIEWIVQYDFPFHWCKKRIWKPRQDICSPLKNPHSRHVGILTEGRYLRHTTLLLPQINSSLKYLRSLISVVKV